MLKYPYIRITDTEELFKRLETEGGRILAGGTDLMLKIKHGMARPKAVYDISGIERLCHPEKCNGCGLCPNWCFKDAITMVGEGKDAKAVIDHNKCEGCGLCPSLCPEDAVTIKGDTPIFLGDFA